jgi:predicted nucleic acid binding AN1-type Zn finger protein
MLSSLHTVQLLSPEFLKSLSELKPTVEQKRCPVCKHKLQLSDTSCRCGMKHCMKHRLPEEHACAFDHKSHDKSILEKTVIACVSDKMNERV